MEVGKTGPKIEIKVADMTEDMIDVAKDLALKSL